MTRNVATHLRKGVRFLRYNLYFRKYSENNRLPLPELDLRVLRLLLTQYAGQLFHWFLLHHLNKESPQKVLWFMIYP